jgi:hypothetical protein
MLWQAITDLNHQTLALIKSQLQSASQHLTALISYESPEVISLITSFFDLEAASILSSLDPLTSRLATIRRTHNTRPIPPPTCPSHSHLFTAPSGIHPALTNLGFITNPPSTPPSLDHTSSQLNLSQNTPQYLVSSPPPLQDLLTLLWHHPLTQQSHSRRLGRCSNRSPLPWPSLPLLLLLQTPFHISLHSPVSPTQPPTQYQYSISPQHPAHWVPPKLI